MLYLLGEISLFLFAAGLIGLFTGLFIQYQLAEQGLQTTIENWRSRLSRSETKRHTLQISHNELVVKVRDQEAELAAAEKRLRDAEVENGKLQQRIAKAKAELAAQWEETEKAIESSREIELRWQQVADERQSEAQTLAAALRTRGQSGKTVTESEEIESLRGMLAERDRLVATLQARLQDLETIEGGAPLPPALVAPPTDTDRNLFLHGESHATEEDHEVVDLEDELPSDPLDTIKGIGSATASRLRELGIRRFAQLAAWPDHELEHWAEQLGTHPETIQAMRWREQAAELARASEP